MKKEEKQEEKEELEKKRKEQDTCYSSIVVISIKSRTLAEGLGRAEIVSDVRKRDAERIWQVHRRDGVLGFVQHVDLVQCQKNMYPTHTPPYLARGLEKGACFLLLSHIQDSL